MKTVALDPGPFIDRTLRDALLGQEIRLLAGATLGEALRLCITNPDVALFLHVLGEGEMGSYERTIAGLREINPLLETVCLCATDEIFDQVRVEAAGKGVFLLPLSADPEESAAAIARHCRESHQGRQAHRIDCNLRAVLYHHDDMDQKLPEDSHVAEVISLSSNGAYVTVGRCEVAEGETYLFEITLPDLIYLVKGRVVWVNLEGNQRGKPRGFALSFLDMSDAPREFLDKRIQEDMIDSILKKRGIL